jgi:hypothetical protein
MEKTNMSERLHLPMWHGPELIYWPSSTILENLYKRKNVIQTNHKTLTFIRVLGSHSSAHTSELGTVYVAAMSDSAKAACGAVSGQHMLNPLIW